MAHMEEKKERMAVADAYQRVCSEYGVQAVVSGTYTSQHQGQCERTNRELRRMTSRKLFTAKLAPRWWYHVWQHACWIRNRLPTKGLMIQESDLSKLKEQKIIPEHVKPYAISPYYALHSKAPDMRNTRVFGSLCFVWQPKSKAENVGKAKALKCIYVGGGQDSMSNRADSCWQCIDPLTGREHLTYHATTVEGSSSRCTWLEKVHGTVGALRAEISSFDKTGLGCPDISTLTKQQMMTIIYEKIVMLSGDV